MTTDPIETETDDDTQEWTNCDNCLDSLTVDDYDANDGLCAQCLASTFTCSECEERTSAHKTHTTLCESCGDSKEEEIAQERLDAAKEAAQEAFDTILDTDDLAVILKALDVLKKITPK
jgi:hypothetical protein